MIIKENNGDFIGFHIKNLKISVNFLNSNETEQEIIKIDNTRIFKTINDLLDFLINETVTNADIEWDISRYKLSQHGNLFMLSKHYSDADVEITFQPIIPRHTMTLEEYFLLTK